MDQEAVSKPDAEMVFKTSRPTSNDQLPAAKLHLLRFDNFRRNRGKGLGTGIASRTEESLCGLSHIFWAQWKCS